MKVALLNLLKNITGKKQTGPTTELSAQVKLEASKKVLVVEDDDALRQLYVEVLTQEGFEAQGAENGEVGLFLINKTQPNLVLLDLMMPVMDGKQMLRRMNEQETMKNIPVIVLTNAGDIDSMREVKFYENTKTFLIKANVTPQDIVNNVKTIV